MGFSFENKRHVVVLIISVVLVWFFFPLIFKAFMFWMRWVDIDLTTFAAYGPVGDIYGSLNTLFTSATLAFVIYSTILQRQANKDARDAMADQLQQAKDATAEQLQQAKDATAEQLQQARDALDAQLKQASEATEQQIKNAKELANTQLEHARESTERQLALAQATHDAQIIESKHAIFSSMFNSLLTQKNELKKSIRVIGDNNEEKTAEDIFNYMDEIFKQNFSANEENTKVKTRIEATRILRNTLIDLGEDRLLKIYRSYFYIYESLIDLVKNANLRESERKFYNEVIGNTMSISEQVCFSWIACTDKRSHDYLKDTGFFWFNYEGCFEFISSILDKSCFSNSNFLKLWESNSEKQIKKTPA